MSHVQVERLRPERIADAAGTLARAFVTNPLHAVVFGPAQLRKNEAFFHLVMKAMKGQKLVAVLDADIVGVIHWVQAPDCQFSALERLRMSPSLVRGVGLRSAVRVISWLSAWARHDPNEPHSHLGPIGVCPDFQGRRIGDALMDRYCEALNRSSESGYLETDRPENVAFYQRFGFEVVKEVAVLGVPSYFMSRESRAA